MNGKKNIENETNMNSNWASNEKWAMSRPSKHITQFVEMYDKNKIINEKIKTYTETTITVHSVRRNRIYWRVSLCFPNNIY